LNCEARARLAGEAELIRRHRAEFDRLLRSKDRLPALVALVDKYKTEYGVMVKAHRDRLEAATTAA
jgi:hypothetical protein